MAATAATPAAALKKRRRDNDGMKISLTCDEACDEALRRSTGMSVAAQAKNLNANSSGFGFIFAAGGAAA
jgi:hypothetical protein